MTELGQLESHYREFEERQTQVVVISLDDQPTAQVTQAQFPHLVVVADDQRFLSEALGVIHQQSAPDGNDTSAPTTFLVDGKGIVRWLFRPDRFLARLSPAQLLAEIDKVKLPSRKIPEPARTALGATKYLELFSLEPDDHLLLAPRRIATNGIR